jgi:hypothetical protein
LCPLCDWHHDTTAAIGGPVADLHAVEGILRQHLETHELIEWVRAVRALRTELDTIEETTVLPALREAGKLDRIRALHSRYRDVYALGDADSCAHCNQISGHRVPWPCPTILAIDGVAAPATRASEPCPTPCDPDCVAACHEGHHPRWKRSHEPADCVASRQASEPRSES